MLTLTAKEFLTALTEGTPVQDGTIITGGCNLEDSKITSFPGVHIKGDLALTRCNNLTEISPDLKVDGRFLVNWNPILANVPDTGSKSVMIWNCEAITSIPAFNGDDLCIAGTMITKISDVNARVIVRLHENKRLVEISNINTPCITVSLSPELGVISDVNVTEELMFNVAPMLRELPDIGDGNTLTRLFLGNTGVQVIPSKLFDAKTKRKDSHIHLENNPELRYLPAVNVLELTILECPGIREVEAGSTIHTMVELSHWVDCGKGTKLNGKLRVRGVELPSKAFDDPDFITAELILKEQNVETRRIYTEKKGFGAFVKEAGGVVIDEINEEAYEKIRSQRGADPIGMKDAKLWRLEPLANDEAIVVVELINSTPEPDGYFKTYFLRVPPKSKTVLEGVAWTFGKDVEDYMPLIES